MALTEVGAKGVRHRGACCLIHGRKHKSRQDQAVLPGVRVWPLRGHWGQEGNTQGLLGALGMLSVLIQELVTWVCLAAADLFRFPNPVGI